MDDTLYEQDESSQTLTVAPDNSSLGQFLSDIFENDQFEYATFSFALDAFDPLAFLEISWNPDAFQYYWEKPGEDFAIAAGKSLKTIESSGSQRFEQIHNQINLLQEVTAEYTAVPHPNAGMMLLGGFSFFNEIKGTLWDGFAPASFTLPEWTVVRDGKFGLATISVALSDFESPATLHQHLTQTFRKICNTCRRKEGKPEHPESEPVRLTPQNGNAEFKHWSNSVEKAKQQIRSGTYDKIVVARHLSVSNSPSTLPTQVVNRLRRKYPNCFNFLLHRPGGKTFLGSTPERLGAFRNKLLLTEALAGSIQRGNTASEDNFLERHLSGSKKNQKEHNFVIRDIEERLKPYTKELARNSRPEIKKLSNVQHLYTPIRAQLNDDVGMLDLLGQLHPTPAVGGYPWNEAKPHLKELEQFDRGWYAGPIGWLNSKNSGEFAVGIRSGLLDQSNAHFFAGCGIVADSDPREEWEETNLKFQPMLSALQYD